MKRKLLLITTCIILTLTGCGSSDAPSTASSNATTEQSTDKKNSENKEERLKSLIVEHGTVDCPCIGWSYEKEPKVYNLYMTDPVIDSIDKDSVTAHGKLSNHYASTEEDVTITFHYEESKEDGIQIFGYSHNPPETHIKP